MATVSFGNTSSAPTTLYKSVSWVLDDIEGHFKDSAEMVHPSFLTQTNVKPYNYAYIPAFSRYYFVREVTALRTGLYQVELDSDPMMSFQGQIVSCPIVAERNTENYNGYIQDSQRAFKQYTWNQYINIGEITWGTGVVVLATVG